jgi:hypothetical protein
MYISLLCLQNKIAKYISKTQVTGQRKLLHDVSEMS